MFLKGSCLLCRFILSTEIDGRNCIYFDMWWHATLQINSLQFHNHVRWISMEVLLFHVLRPYLYHLCYGCRCSVGMLLHLCTCGFCCRKSAGIWLASWFPKLTGCCVCAEQTKDWIQVRIPACTFYCWSPMDGTDSLCLLIPNINIYIFAIHKCIKCPAMWYWHQTSLKQTKVKLTICKQCSYSFKFVLTGLCCVHRELEDRIWGEEVLR
jgi:hypothetical protein